MAEKKPAQKPKPQTQQPAQTTEPIRADREKDLFTWSQQSRPFKKRDKEFWVSVVAIAAISSFIIFIIEGAMPVILIIALVFLFYILSTVPPEKIQYKLTTYGVKIADKLNPWDNFTRFWFGERLDSDLLVFEMITLPGRLELVINPKDKSSLKKVLNKYLLQEEATPSNIERTADWLSKKIPGR